MEFENTQALFYLFDNIDMYMLIVARIVGLLTLMPVLGGTSVPSMVKMGLAMGIAIIVFASDNIEFIVYTHGSLAYGLIIFKEFFVGFIMSFIIFVMFNLVYVTGEISDKKLGYAQASTVDPMTSNQVPVTGGLYYFSICALFVINGGHYMVLKAFLYSYEALPLGSAFIIGNGNLFLGISSIMADFFSIALLLAVPIIGVILTVEVVLGSLVRAVPKMNVFVVSMPLKAFVGLFAIWLTMPSLAEIYTRIYNIISETLFNVIRTLAV